MIESKTTISSGDVARHYDQLDRFYREIWGDHVHHGLWRTGRETPDEATRALVDAVVAKAAIRSGAKVCDLGCGYGATSRIIARECGAEVTGLTLSATQQTYAQSVTQPATNPRFLIEDWMTNHRSDEEFDAVVAIESTEHMEDKARVFSEVARVLTPGGRVVVCAWLAAEQPQPWQSRFLLEPICREGRMPGLGTETDYRHWMGGAGLQVREADDVSAHVARTWPICAWRFVKALLLRPAYLRFLLDPKNDNRIFALTMLRLWLAYRTQAMRYVIFKAEKPVLLS